MNRFSQIRAIFTFLLMTGLIFKLYAQQIQVSGIVKDERNEPLVGVNIVVKGKVIGTISDINGDFKFVVQDNPPITLSISMIGFATQEIEVTENSVNLEFTLVEDITTLGEVIVRSATRTEENIMQSPVSIEKMGILDIRNTASDDYYKAIANMKGVEMTQSSINFQIINARGFGSTGNTRFVQLTDGMDTQAPALNFPIGNLNGPSSLDVESVEFILGAASALYGPNAFNGILLVTSKSPFEYQGLSATVKLGVNHIGADESLGEPADPQPMYEAALRYAKAFNNKFAFKIGLSYMEAEDWNATNFSDKNDAFKGDLTNNPSYDGVNLYGDDGGINLGLIRNSPSISTLIAQALVDNFNAGGVPLDLPNALLYVQSLPAVNVNRTGYREHYLVDYGAKNLKVNLGLNYRLNDNTELSYQYNYGGGTSVYTGAQRYSLKNFNIQQHRLELKADNWNLMGYTTIEDSGDSYIADFTGFGINNAYLDNATWFGTYSGSIASQYIFKVFTATGSPDFDPAIVGNMLNNPVAMNSVHTIARASADANRWEAGSLKFQQAADSVNSGIIPDGSRFNDQTLFYHTEGQYNFKNEIQIFDLMVGASYRRYDLRSKGTIFPDSEANPIIINEYGGFLQLTDKYINDQLKLVFSVRYDKNENFDGQFSPRLSGVYTILSDHNIRASFQTGFRNPTTQGQYIDLNVITARLLGGLQEFHDKYQVSTYTYTIQSVDEFTESFANGTLDPTVLIKYTTWKPVQPERIKVFEIGYKALINNRLMIDVNYYHNTYDDFITQVRVRQAQDTNGDPTNPFADPTLAAFFGLLTGDANDTYQIYTNLNQTVKSQGATVGFDYSIIRGYRAGFNYSWNQLNTSDLSVDFINDYNTPEHIMNISFGNRKVTDNFGFNIALRWQDAFIWTSSFVQDGLVPSFRTLDAQVSYKLSGLRSILKIGGSNLLNDRYISSYGGPTIGAIYYISLTFDELMN